MEWTPLQKQSYEEFWREKLNETRQFGHKSFHEIFIDFTEELLSDEEIKEKLADSINWEELPKTFALESSSMSLEGCIDRGFTYGQKLRVALGDCKSIYLGVIPKITELGTLIIKGNEGVVVPQLVLSSGLFFESEKEISASFFPKRGVKIKFTVTVKRDANKEIKVKIPGRKSKQSLQVGDLLKCIEVSEKSLSNLKKVFGQVKGFSPNLIETPSQKTDFESKLDDLYEHLFGDSPPLEKKERLIRKRLLDENEFGKIGRWQINRQLNTEESITNLTEQDIIGAIQYLVYLDAKKPGYKEDNKSHLANRKVVLIGDFLEQIVTRFFSKIHKSILDDIYVDSVEEIDVSALSKMIEDGYNQSLGKKIIESFTSSSSRLSSLWQLLPKTNCLADIAYTYRITQKGPGGIKKHMLEPRNVHWSHYGRICGVNTPKGENIGLVLSLTPSAKVNELGLLETPYYKIQDGQTGAKDSLTAEQEENNCIAYADQRGKLTESKKSIWARKGQKELEEIEESSEISYIDVSSAQMLSVSASLVPFLEHNDANRALMGANMMRQALPLLSPEPPSIKTGQEKKIARWLYAPSKGTVSIRKKNRYEKSITVKDDDGNKHCCYPFLSYQPTISHALKTHKLLVNDGEKVNKGQLLADETTTVQGELALGRDVLVAFMPWKGYNFEDAIVISEKLCQDDTFSSLHIVEVEKKLRKRQIQIGRLYEEYNEEITKDLPDRDTSELANLDEHGIVKEGSYVNEGDVLVGAVAPVKERYVKDKPLEQLSISLFGKAGREVADVSLTVPEDIKGKVVKVLDLRKEKGELPPNCKEDRLIKVRIAYRRPITIGDKLANRHGGKGIVAKIVPEDEMPRLEDGTPIEVILNPMGVIGRMNLGQIYETHLGWAAKVLGCSFLVPPFEQIQLAESPNNETLKKALEEVLNAQGPRLQDSPEDAEQGEGEGLKRWKVKQILEIANRHRKVKLKDGKARLHVVDTKGKKNYFDNPVTVGYLYMMKLNHLAEEKEHTRSTGIRSAFTEQPMRGAEYEGGQRIGEMEVWALQAHGAAHIIQELLTLRSGDVRGRRELMRVLSSLNVTKDKLKEIGGNPEANRIMIYLLRGLGYEVRLFSDSKDITKDYLPDKLRDFDSLLIRTASADEITSWSSGEIKNPDIFDKGADNYAPEGLFSEQIFGNVRDFCCQCGLHKGGSSTSVRCNLCGTTLGQARLLRRTRMGHIVLADTMRHPFTEKPLEVISVIPPAFRPILSEARTLSEVSEKYQRILRQNKALEEFQEREAPKVILDHKKQGLQKTVDDLFNAIMALLEGKKGFLRRHMLGKRIDFSGRAVIAVDPTLQITQCRLPIEMGIKLYKPLLIRELTKECYKKTKEMSKARKKAVEILRNWSDKKALINQIVRRVSRKYPVVLNRQPSLHGLSMQAFTVASLEDAHVIFIHPMVTAGYNADFDGDTMSAFPIFLPEERREVKRLSSSEQLLSPANGKLSLHLGQDIALGIFYYTLEKSGQEDLSQLLDVKINTPVDLKIARDLLQDYYHAHLDDRSECMKVFEKIKEKSFSIATQSGTTISLFDFPIPPQTEKTQKEGENKFEFSQRVQNWVIEKLRQKKEQNNPISLILFSGARGDEDVVRQVSGMRGVMEHPLRVVGALVHSSLIEGLTVGEYFTSYYGSRRTLMDKALSTGESGYLTRKLVNAAQEVLITKKDCGTHKGIVYSVEAEKDITSRLLGRVLAEDIEVEGVCIAAANTVIDEKICQKIIEMSVVEEVKIRSPATCDAESGVCRHCYGWNLATQELPEKNTPVGIVAALSIGERGTQLALQSFHRGGVVEETTQDFSAARRFFNGKSKLLNEVYYSDASGFDLGHLVKALLEEIRSIYPARAINDKHFEVIIRQMLQRVEIVDSGDSSFTTEQRISRKSFEEEYEKLKRKGKELPQAKLLSLKQIISFSDSWLAQASFETTKNILKEAARSGQKDSLEGIKEKIMLGKLIPYLKQEGEG